MFLFGVCAFCPTLQRTAELGTQYIGNCPHSPFVLTSKDASTEKCSKTLSILPQWKSSPECLLLLMKWSSNWDLLPGDSKEYLTTHPASLLKKLSCLWLLLPGQPSERLMTSQPPPLIANWTTTRHLGKPRNLWTGETRADPAYCDLKVMHPPPPPRQAHVWPSASNAAWGGEGIDLLKVGSSCGK